MRKRSIVGRLLVLLGSQLTWVALTVLLGVMTIGSGVALMFTSAWLISMAALHPSIAALQLAIVGVRFFGISRGVFRYLERYVSHKVTFRLLTRLKEWFYDAIEPLSPASMSAHRAGDLLTRAVGDIESLESFFVRAVSPPVVALITIIILGAFLTTFNIYLAILISALFILVGLGFPGMIAILSRKSARNVITSRARLQVEFVDGLSGIADLAAFNRQDHVSERVYQNLHVLQTAESKLMRIEALQRGLTVLVSQLGMWIALVLSIVLVSRGQLDGVYLAALALATLASFEAITPLPEAARELNTNIKAGERIFDVVGESRGDSVSLTHTITLNNFDISVSDLWLRYTNDEPYVLKGVDLVLPENGRIAIVGPSGAGKTSLLNCLLRFWEFERGSIRIGDVEIQKMDRQELRRQTGVVSQDAYLFNASIRENLLIAKPEATQNELTRALRLAQLDPLLQSLPQGMDTLVGEKGFRLSAGERRRVVIARVFLRDLPLLFLDEVTANLDALTERSIMDALHRLMEGRTTLLLTHRLVDLEKMDEILVLHSGQIIERGRHDELIHSRGVYYRSWSLQQQMLE